MSEVVIKIIHCKDKNVINAYLSEIQESSVA